jgi:hypothetical protein
MVHPADHCSGCSCTVSYPRTAGAMGISLKPRKIEYLSKRDGES